MHNTTRDSGRIVISGLGIISPVGIGREAFWRSLRSGQGALQRVELYDLSLLPGGVGAEIRDFNPTTVKKQFLKAQRKSIKVMCRDIQLGVASAALAIEDAALESDQLDHDRMGVEFGSNLMLTPPNTLQDPNRAG